MRTLDIAMKSDRTNSGWELVLGHCCKTDEEVKEYAKQINSSNLRIVPIGFDNGGWIVPKKLDL